MPDLTLQNYDSDLVSSLEALLFVASGPISISQLSGVLEKESLVIENGLRDLERLLNEGRGLSLQRHSGMVQLTTAAAKTEVVEKYLGLESTTHLSRASLEALAIVAYRQPITRPGIDAVRGVNSDGVIKSLLSKGLVQEVGRADGPGRPILYATTVDFLQYFGLSSITDLPPFELQETVAKPENGKLLKD